MRLSPQQRSIINARFIMLCREVGTLLLAFVPLDYSLADNASGWRLIALFVAGAALFAYSVYSDVRGVHE